MNNKRKTIIVVLLFVSFLGAQTVSANEDNSEPPEEINEEHATEEAEDDSLPNGQAMEVTSNTDETGEVFDPTIQFPELEGKKQFLSFQTPERETYHIVVEYGRNNTSTHVYLLKSVKDQEIENIATGNLAEQEEPTSETFIEDTNSNEEVEEIVEVANVETKDESETSSIGQKLLIFGIVFTAVIVFYFLKKRNNSDNNYDDE